MRVYLGPPSSAGPGLGLSLQEKALGHREAQPQSKQRWEAEKRDVNNLELLTHVAGLTITANPFTDVPFRKITWV